MPQVSFSKDKRQFHIELNQRVNEYFKTKQLSQRGVGIIVYVMGGACFYAALGSMAQYCVVNGIWYLHGFHWF